MYSKVNAAVKRGHVGSAQTLNQIKIKGKPFLKNIRNGKLKYVLKETQGIKKNILEQILWIETKSLLPDGKG